MPRAAAPPPTAHAASRRRSSGVARRRSRSRRRRAIAVAPGRADGARAIDVAQSPAPGVVSVVPRTGLTDGDRHRVRAHPVDRRRPVASPTGSGACRSATRSWRSTSRWTSSPARGAAARRDRRPARRSVSTALPATDGHVGAPLDCVRLLHRRPERWESTDRQRHLRPVDSRRLTAQAGSGTSRAPGAVGVDDLVEEPQLLVGRQPAVGHVVGDDELEAGGGDHLVDASRRGARERSRIRWSGVSKSNTPRLDTTRRISWKRAAAGAERGGPVVADAAHDVDVLDEHLRRRGSAPSTTWCR